MNTQLKRKGNGAYKASWADGESTGDIQSKLKRLFAETVEMVTVKKQ